MQNEPNFPERMNDQNQAQDLAAIHAEVLETLLTYFKMFENANVKASVLLRIQVIREMFEYILESINCRIYLLQPEKHNLFTIIEKKVAEFMADPKAQADNRFMNACQALDIFLQNGRILKAVQAAAHAPPPPPPPAPVPIILNFEDDDLHAEQDAHDVNLREWYNNNDDYNDYDTDDYDDDYDDEGVGRGVAELGHREEAVPVAAVAAAAAQPVLLLREIMNDYFDRIIAEADIHQKVVIAVELFAWLKLNDRRQQQHLMAPENKDIFDDLDFLVEDLLHNPVNAAAVQANAAFQFIHVDIKAFIAYGIAERFHPANVAKEVENDITSILSVEDDDLKAQIAFDLFTWLNQSKPTRQALLAPENDYLCEEFSWLVEQEMPSIPAYAVALAIKICYRINHDEIKKFVSHWQQLVSQRNEEQEDDDAAAVPAAVPAAESEYCRRCDEPLFENEGEIGYCHDCAMCKFERQH